MTDTPTAAPAAPPGGRCRARTRPPGMPPGSSPSCSPSCSRRRLRAKGYSDLKFEDAITIKTNGSVPPIKSDIYAYAEVIGYRDEEGHLQAPRSPFEAGSQITLASEDLIRHVLGLQAEKENGAYLGLLKGHDLPVYLNIDSLVQKHICILAKTGGGKSYACGVLIEELLKKKIPLVIIDTHGEYISLGKPNKDKKDTKNMEKFGIKPNDYSSQMCKRLPAQEPHLR